MTLFTLVMDYRGGTYVSQATFNELADLLSNVDRAIDWDALEVLGVVKMTPAARQQFVEHAVEFGAPPLDKLQNVWCFSALVEDALALVTIVATLRER